MIPNDILLSPQISASCSHYQRCFLLQEIGASTKGRCVERMRFWNTFLNRMTSLYLSPQGSQSYAEEAKRSECFVHFFSIKKLWKKIINPVKFVRHQIIHPCLQLKVNKTVLVTVNLWQVNPQQRKPKRPYEPFQNIFLWPCSPHGWLIHHTAHQLNHSQAF